jgi:hypothetical protein
MQSNTNSYAQNLGDPLGDPSGSVNTHACVSGPPSCISNPAEQLPLLAPQGIKENCSNGNSDSPLTDATPTVEKEYKLANTTLPPEEYFTDEGEFADKDSDGEGAEDPAQKPVEQSTPCPRDKWVKPLNTKIVTLSEEMLAEREFQLMEATTYEKYRKQIICGHCGAKNHRNKGPNGEKSQKLFRKTSVSCRSCNKSCRLATALLVSNLHEAHREFTEKSASMLAKGSTKKWGKPAAKKE